MNSEDFCTNIGSIEYMELSKLFELYPVSVIKYKYLSLLSQLTTTPEITDELFEKRVQEIGTCGKIFVGVTKNDIEQGDVEIVGSGTVIVEPKIFRNGRSVAHVEDIVVDKNHRGQGIAQEILNRLKDYAVQTNCYKIILDCDENVCKVYEKNGFEIKGVQMGKYLLNE